MPRDLWPSAGVEYSRVRKEIAAARTAMQIAKREAEAYRMALFLARRHVVLASQQAPSAKAIWWALSVMDSGLAQQELSKRKAGRPLGVRVQ